MRRKALDARGLPATLQGRTHAQKSGGPKEPISEAQPPRAHARTHCSPARSRRRETRPGCPLALARPATPKPRPPRPPSPALRGSLGQESPRSEDAGLPKETGARAALPQALATGLPAPPPPGTAGHDGSVVPGSGLAPGGGGAGTTIPTGPPAASPTPIRTAGPAGVPCVLGFVGSRPKGVGGETWCEDPGTWLVADRGGGSGHDLEFAAEVQTMFFYVT